MRFNCQAQKGVETVESTRLHRERENERKKKRKGDREKERERIGRMPEDRSIKPSWARLQKLNVASPVSRRNRLHVTALDTAADHFIPPSGSGLGLGSFAY